MNAAAAGGLRLRIGYAIVDAESRDDVTRAIAAANENSRIPGLIDDLNLAIIDPAKARALLDALTPGAAAALGARALDLNAAALQISTASPTTPSAFAAPMRLTVESEHGQSVTARAGIAVDCPLARTKAAAARARAGEADREVTALELGSNGGALSAAKRLRYAVALTWSANAGFAASCAPADAAAAADRDAAAAAAQRWVILGGSMQ